MARLSLPEDADLSAIQREIIEETLVGPRGAAPIPFAAWIHSPELARRAQSLGACIRFDSGVAPRHAHLGAMLTARRFSTDYVWAGHSAGAREAGLSAEAVRAIARRKRPAFDQNEDALVHDFVVQLLADGRVDDALYAACEAAFGAARLVELTALVAYYSFVCMTLNAFEIATPENPDARLPA